MEPGDPATEQARRDYLDAHRDDFDVDSGVAIKPWPRALVDEVEANTERLLATLDLQDGTQRTRGTGWCAPSP